jgi:Uma2 family endonuclease
MTFALERPISRQLLTFEEFLVQYREDDRFELIDGEVFDLEPTGPHEQVAAFITRKLDVQIDRFDLSYFALQRGILKPLGDFIGFRPDVMIVDRNALSMEPLWKKESILTLGSSIKFVAEVVSSNWQNDYARKVDDYALMGIPEYWIADYGAFGGVKYIGYPKQATLTICTLAGKEYHTQILRGDDPIVSPTFPALTLTAAQVLESGEQIF